MLTATTLFISGVSIGVLGTLIGAGGGWMIVPLLLLGFKFTPQEAVGTSLAVVFVNALSGSIAYMVQGRVLYAMGTTFAIATIPGAVLGALIVTWLFQRINTNWFTALFGVFLLFIALLLHRGERLLLSRIRRQTASPEELRSLTSPTMRLGMVVSFFVGVFSSLFGVGGGIIHVPFLIVVLGIPVHTATATSHFVLTITSLTGALTMLERGQVRLSTAAWMGLGVLMGAQGGAYLSARMRSGPIRRLLAGALALFAVRLILRFAF